MPNTGVILRDAIKSMKVSLDTKKSAWKVREVYDYPAHKLGIVGPAITIEITGCTTDYIQGSHPVVSIDYNVGLRINFFSDGTDLSREYLKVAAMLDNIVQFLFIDSTPDGFGELLASGSGAVYRVNEISGDLAGTQLFGGSVDCTLTFSKVHTQT